VDDDKEAAERVKMAGGGPFVRGRELMSDRTVIAATAN
jgi:hypothetical protein